MAFECKRIIGIYLMLFVLIPVGVFPDQGDWEKTEVAAQNYNILKCPEGSVIYSINCQGRYCEDKTVICIHYSGGIVGDARTEISLPFPRQEGEHKENESSFIHGIYDDSIAKELRIRYLKTEKLANTGICGWNSIAVENGRIVRCPDKTLPAGIRCIGEDCQTIVFYCCEYLYTGE